MRVLHVIPAVAARYGGPSAAIAPMCRALKERGLDPLIVTTDADGDGRLPVEIARETIWEGTRAIFFRRNASESFKYSRGLARWLSHNVHAFDVVHVHAILSHASLAAAAAARRRRVPYVIRPLGTLAPWSLRQRSYRKRALLWLGAAALLRDAAAIHCTSEQEQRDIEITLRLSRSVVIPLGIDPAILDQPPAPESEREHDPYCLALSRIHPKKNLEAVIESFLTATAGNEWKQWRLVIAGTGGEEYTAALRRLVQARGAESRVTFAGWVEGEQKRALMRKASVFVLASLHENFGVSLLEALAIGVPGLVSREVDLADAVEAVGAGWVVDTSQQSLSQGFRDALHSADARAAKAKAARELAKQFIWPRIGARLIDLYRDLSPAAAETFSVS